MRLIGELRHRARYVVGPFLGICAAAYFTYHAIQGDRGLMAWARLSHDVETLRSEREGLARHRAALEHRVKLLHPESLDPDMLDERARVMLNFGYPNELVIFVPRHRS
ncbi:MAG: septum formation initiator family protein [Rhodospirillales bacterium]|nr:septum formation initiator family protein [Rhodospirillales bacterium]